MPQPQDEGLAAAIHASLDRLLASLQLETIGDGEYRAMVSPGMFEGRIFGGQLLAQALVAAGATVVDKAADSLHAAFVDVGEPGPIDATVDRVRDGRSMSTRRVTLHQQGKTLLVAIVSFHASVPGVEVGATRPEVPAPSDLPTLQEWVAKLPTEWSDYGRNWIERPPPVKIRTAEPPTFLGGPTGEAPRSHWMRVPRAVGDDGVLNAALLAYASDYFLMDMIFRTHPEGTEMGKFSGFSLDHAIWFHRVPRFDQWHLHTQEAVAITGDRGLTRGALHDEAGNLVASVMQEILIRPGRPRR